MSNKSFRDILLISNPQEKQKKLNEYKNSLKSILFKIWDKEVENGREPQLNDKIFDFLNAEKRGIFTRTVLFPIFHEYFKKYGNIINSIDNKLNKVFDTEDYVENFNIGGYNFKFKCDLDYYDENENELGVFCVVLKGGEVTLMETGETVNFDELNNNPKYEDILWEIESEISDICNDILNYETGLRYGLKIDVVQVLLGN